jgi:hypothetical protein
MQIKPTEFPAIAAPTPCCGGRENDDNYLNYNHNLNIG